MYRNFDFEKRDNLIKGYEFPCENATKVMCIVHGIGEHAGRYKRMASYLNAAGIAVVSMDLRGHGLSQGKRGHTAPRQEVIKDIDALIEYAGEMYPGLSITLYGHSMGGNLVMDYLMTGNKNDIPDNYIVSAPWIELAGGIPKVLPIAMKILSKVAPKLSISSGCNESDLGKLEFVRPYLEDELVHDKITALCAYECYKAGIEMEYGNHPNNNGADGKPLLLMHGDADKICSVVATRNLAKLLEGRPDFEYKEWAGYYHEIHNGGPDSTGEEAIKKIMNFVTEH